MIPDFDELGQLPPGVHLASLDEVAERFGSQSEIRREEVESLRWLVPLARCAGITRLVINGSFVTDRAEPNDVDCVLLAGEDLPRDRNAEAALLAGLPFLDIRLVGQDDFDAYLETVFGLDRYCSPKGMVEVMLWS
ncbi:MAG: DUF6932 family protein [Thermoguttaceae bacterium]